MNSPLAQQDYQDIWYTSHDGLKLYARDYSAQQAGLSRGTILCMPGLTRNSADFSIVANHMRKHYRVIAVDQRGRGNSNNDPNPLNYHPGCYVEDMFCLIDHLQLNNIILLGTSLGGLMSLIMASIKPELFNGIILNDVGPEVDTAGLNRIQAYVGKQPVVNNWQDAIQQAQATNQQALPDLDHVAWERFTRAIYREGEEGQLELAYDPAISLNMKVADDASVQADLWPQFTASNKKPMLVIRGESSDILSIDCVKKMCAIHKALVFCQIPNRGHTPLLDEPESLRALKTFLANLPTANRY